LYRQSIPLDFQFINYSIFKIWNLQLNGTLLIEVSAWSQNVKPQHQLSLTAAGKIFFTEIGKLIAPQKV
jgi:hypothetical protein